jgi:hypothetical protein
MLYETDLLFGDYLNSFAVSSFEVTLRLMQNNELRKSNLRHRFETSKTIETLSVILNPATIAKVCQEPY